MSQVVLGPVAAIPKGEGRNFLAQGQEVAVFHTREGQLFAVQARCPHRDGPLADGLVGGTTLICPLHNWKFDLRTGAPFLGDCPLKTYAIRRDDADQIVLTVD